MDPLFAHLDSSIIDAGLAIAAAPGTKSLRNTDGCRFVDIENSTVSSITEDSNAVSSLIECDEEPTNTSLALFVGFASGSCLVLLIVAVELIRRR